jgi:hypothetical protein
VVSDITGEKQRGRNKHVTRWKIITIAARQPAACSWSWAQAIARSHYRILLFVLFFFIILFLSLVRL